MEGLEISINKNLCASLTLNFRQVGVVLSCRHLAGETPPAACWENAYTILAATEGRAGDARVVCTCAQAFVSYPL